MLVCQAIEHDLLLATADDVVRQYPVKTFPAE
jgi:PIN domain nuclease of toxin-antitoxin system